MDGAGYNLKQLMIIKFPVMKMVILICYRKLLIKSILLLSFTFYVFGVPAQIPKRNAEFQKKIKVVPYKNPVDIPQKEDQDVPRSGRIQEIPNGILERYMDSILHQIAICKYNKQQSLSILRESEKKCINFSNYNMCVWITRKYYLSQLIKNCH